MKEKILEILQRYDQPMCDPHYSGIEPEQFDELANKLCEFFMETFLNIPDIKKACKERIDKAFDDWFMFGIVPKIEK